MNIFDRFEQIANEQFDGHYTIMKFTGGYRAAFGTIASNDYYETYFQIQDMPEDSTLEMACKKAIDEMYAFPAIMSEQELRIRTNKFLM